MPTTTGNQANLKSAKNLSYIFSSICLIHCLAMPFVILLIPAFSHFLSDTFELILILSVIPISIYAFLPTWLNHKNSLLGTIFVIGVLLILISQFGMDHLHALDPAQIFASNDNTIKFISRTGVMISGVVLIALAVYRNNKHTHVCHNPHHHH